MPYSSGSPLAGVRSLTSPCFPFLCCTAAGEEKKAQELSAFLTTDTAPSAANDLLLVYGSLRAAGFKGSGLFSGHQGGVSWRAPSVISPNTPCATGSGSRPSREVGTQPESTGSRPPGGCSGAGRFPSSGPDRCRPQQRRSSAPSGARASLAVSIQQEAEPPGEECGTCEPCSSMPETGSVFMP